MFFALLKRQSRTGFAICSHFNEYLQQICYAPRRSIEHFKLHIILAGYLLTLHKMPRTFGSHNVWLLCDMQMAVIVFTFMWGSLYKWLRGTLPDQEDDVGDLPVSTCFALFSSLCPRLRYSLVHVPSGVATSVVVCTNKKPVLPATYLALRLETKSIKQKQA